MCWGKEIWQEVKNAKSAKDARHGVEAYGQTRKITTMFKKLAEKGKVSYSIQQPTPVHCPVRTFLHNRDIV